MSGRKGEGQGARLAPGAGNADVGANDGAHAGETRTGARTHRKSIDVRHFDRRAVHCKDMEPKWRQEVLFPLHSPCTSAL